MTRYAHMRALLLALIPIVSLPAQAAVPGDFDGSFGQGGSSIQLPAATTAAAKDILVLPNSDILVATAPVDALGSTLVVERYAGKDVRAADGTLLIPAGNIDTRFGTGGRVTFPGTGELAALALAPGNKVVVAGYITVSAAPRNDDFLIGRIDLGANLDGGTGSVDTTFATNGMVTLPGKKVGDYLKGVVVDSNGNIVAAGYSATTANPLATTGADPVTVAVSASGAGATYSQISRYLVGDEANGWLAANASWSAIAAAADGTLYVTGDLTRNSDYSVTPIVAKLSAGGALLATRVLVTTRANGSSINHLGRAIAVANDGAVVVAGAGPNNPSEGAFRLYRVLPADLASDPSFGSVGDGRQSVDIGIGEGFALPPGRRMDLVLQKNGRIVLAGGVDRIETLPGEPDTGVDAVMVRLESDGSRDQTFGSNGVLFRSLVAGQQVEGFHALALSPDGDLVGAGTNVSGTQEGVALARIVGDRAGLPDLSCGVDGVRILSPGSYSFGRAVLPTADGGFLAITNSNTYKFDRHGVAVPGYNNVGINGTLMAATYDVNGKIVVAGYSLSGELLVARHHPNGNIDTTFGAPAGNGQRTGWTSIALGGASVAYGVMVQPHDNRIVVVGRTLQGGNTKFSLVRLHEDGDLDAKTETNEGFGGDGIVVTPETGNSSQAFDVAIDSQRRLVVVGVGNVNYGHFVVARYLDNGELDTSFADNQVVVPNEPLPVDGIFTIKQGYRDRAHAVRILPNDGVLVVGQIGKGLTSALALLRLNVEGEVVGTTTIPVPGDFDAGIHDVGLTVQADGKYVLAGYVRDTDTSDGDQGYQGLLVRVNADFSLDTTFGDAGLLLLNPSPGNGSDDLRAVAVRSDGRIVALGYSTPGVGGATATAICIHP